MACDRTQLVNILRQCGTPTPGFTPVIYYVPMSDFLTPVTLDVDGNVTAFNLATTGHFQKLEISARKNALKANGKDGGYFEPSIEVLHPKINSVSSKALQAMQNLLFAVVIVDNTGNSLIAQNLEFMYDATLDDSSNDYKITFKSGPATQPFLFIKSGTTIPLP